jgi:RNA polymerase sigma factor (sigma-70 family)
VLRHIHQLAGVDGAGELTDAQLLERFAGRHEESAFAALVQRHGPMVLGVCRRVLNNAHDAEDAFQATFLILVRKAGSISNPEALGCWLHEVALRTALRARANLAARRQRERRVPTMPQTDFIATVVWRDLQPILDEEVRRLPDRYRVPFVLCYLEGKTYAVVARQLRCLPGTISRRLAQARDLLRRRLTRRGLALPAGVLAAALSQNVSSAALPATLAAATVKTALLGAAGKTAAGGVSPHVAALTEGGIKAMRATTWKWTLTLLVLVGLAGAGLGVLALATAEEPDQNASAKARPKPAAKKAAAGNTVTVAGRVLDADGKPVAAASVAIVASARYPARITRPWGDEAGQVRNLGQGKTDDKGGFRLTVPRLSRKRFADVYALAGAPGHSMGRAGIDTGARPPDVQIRLAREQVLHGRLVGLQGKPAAGVRVDVLQAVGYLPARQWFATTFYAPPRGLAPWPAPAVTDAKGRFTLRGLGPEWMVKIHVRDPRFAREDFDIQAADWKGGKEVARSLAPARVLEGSVTYGDTRKPVASARLVVMCSQQRYGSRVSSMTGKTDAQGRFRLVPYPGRYFELTAYPPAGEPYLLMRREINWRQADLVKQEVQLALVRAVLVRGTVIEQSSGKPVAGASVYFEPNRDNNPYFREDVRPFWVGGENYSLSGKDGTFQLGVLPGPGHLLIRGPTLDYVHVEIGSKQIYGRQINPNWRYYFDGVVPLNLKPQAGTHEVKVTLRRGVTIKGNVVGPDGKPVAQGVLVCRSYIPFGKSLNPARTKEVKDGRFELPGCDPDRPAQVFFLDPKNRLGATVELSAKKAGGKPVTVRLQRSGSATARILDKDGKPVAGMNVDVQVLITPGIPFAGSLLSPMLIADTASMSMLDPARHGDLKSDAQGRITFPTLVPGATCWLIGIRHNRTIFDFKKEFKAEAGKTLDLGNLLVPPK